MPKKSRTKTKSSNIEKEETKENKEREGMKEDVEKEKGREGGRKKQWMYGGWVGSGLGHPPINECQLSKEVTRFVFDIFEL